MAMAKTKKAEDETRDLGPMRKVVAVVRAAAGWQTRVAHIPEEVFAKYETTEGAHPADLRQIAHSYATRALFGNETGLIE